LEEHEKGNDEKESGTAKQKLQNTIAILMNERSMLSQMNFGLAKKQLQEQRMNVDILLKTSDGGGSCHGLVWG
jgi:hypothetical protein